MYQILFFFISETHEEYGQNACRKQKDEYYIPAEMLRHPSEQRVRQEEGSEEVTEESGESGGRSGEFLFGKAGTKL